MPLSKSVSQKIASASTSSVELFPGASQMSDWLDTQSKVMTLWLDRLIAEGDPADLVSMVHRQACWMDMMRGRLNNDEAA